MHILSCNTSHRSNRMRIRGVAFLPFLSLHHGNIHAVLGGSTHIAGTRNGHSTILSGVKLALVNAQLRISHRLRGLDSHRGKRHQFHTLILSFCGHHVLFRRIQQRAGHGDRGGKASIVQIVRVHQGLITNRITGRLALLISLVHANAHALSRTLAVEPGAVHQHLIRLCVHLKLGGRESDLRVCLLLRLGDLHGG